MKTIVKASLALFTITAIFLSCKRAEAPAEEAVNRTVTDISTGSETQTESVSSDTVKKRTGNRKVIRTADLKFKVANVAKSTSVIESATAQFGGFVANSNLHSDISERREVKISSDSTLILTKYTVQNDITIRVPNTQLDTVIKTIAKEIDFLDLRVIKADDVSLQMMSNQLSQNRSRMHEKRLANAIDSKGKKLNQIVDAEEELALKKEVNDSKKIENLSLQDQVAFSTLTLNIYQPESIRKEKTVASISIRPNIGLQLMDGLRTGWYILESILAFLVQLWSLALLGILGFLTYKKFLKKTKPAI